MYGFKDKEVEFEKETSNLPTCTPKHTHLSLDYPLAFFVVFDHSSVSGY